MGLLSALKRSLGELVSVDTNGNVRPPSMTLAQFWNDHHLPFLDTKRPSTKRQHVYRWGMWIEPTLGHLRLDEITAPVIAQFNTNMRRNARFRRRPDGPMLAPQTIHAVSVTLSGVISNAVSMGHIDSNPCRHARRYLPEMELSPRNKQRAQRLSKEQARALIYTPSVAQWKRDEYAGAVYLCTRRGELHGLRWRCVFLDASTPFVRIEKSHNGPTKTGAVRDVPIHPELMPFLRRMRDERKPKPDDLVYPTRRGRMQTNHAGHHFYETLRELELPDIVFHALRKTGATLYRAAGMSRDAVGDVLGHAKTVTDTYAPSQIHVTAKLMSAMSILEVDDDAHAEVA